MLMYCIARGTKRIHPVLFCKKRTAPRDLIFLFPSPSSYHIPNKEKYSCGGNVFGSMMFTLWQGHPAAEGRAFCCERAQHWRLRHLDESSDGFTKPMLVSMSCSGNVKTNPNALKEIKTKQEIILNGCLGCSFSKREQKKSKKNVIRWNILFLCMRRLMRMHVDGYLLTLMQSLTCN